MLDKILVTGDSSSGFAVVGSKKETRYPAGHSAADSFIRLLNRGIMTQYSSNKPIEIFISYSHKDERMRNELVEHLANLKNQGVITAWHDRRISAGNEWAGEIDQHLNTASVILLLISAHFMASDYCNDVEVKRAMKRYDAGDAIIIPVILRPVDWAHAPFSKLQALPKDAKPVLRWSNRDEAYLDIVNGIRSAILDLGKPNTPDAPLHVTKRTSLPPDSATPVANDKIANASRYEDVKLLLEQFFQPISNRLKKDTAIWEA